MGSTEFVGGGVLRPSCPSEDGRNDGQSAACYYKHHYLPGVLCAPGTIRTCDTRFRKRLRDVRGCSSLFAKVRLIRSFCQLIVPPLFADYRPDSASVATTLLPRTPDS